MPTPTLNPRAESADKRLPVHLTLPEFVNILYTAKEQDKLFPTLPGESQHFFYPNGETGKTIEHYVTRPGCILFRPVSDKKLIGLNSTNYLGLYKNTIQNLLASRLLEENPSIIFPLMEYERGHFVVLHYDPETQKATIIESVASAVSRLYSLAPLKEAIQEVGLPIQGDIETVYQNIQYRDGPCGHWAAQNCMTLYGAFANDPRRLEYYFTHWDEGPIRRYQDKLSLDDSRKNQCSSYQPVPVDFFQRHWGKFTVLNMFLGMTAVFLLSASIIYATGGLAAVPLIATALGGIGLIGALAAGGIIAGIAGIFAIGIMGVGVYISTKLQSKKEQQEDKAIRKAVCSQEFQQENGPSIGLKEVDKDGFTEIIKEPDSSLTQPCNNSLFATDNKDQVLVEAPKDNTRQRP